jgi:23S rRNA (pseudouridine1915-N3)-methyltransferase
LKINDLAMLNGRVSVSSEYENTDTPGRGLQIDIAFSSVSYLSVQAFLGLSDKLLPMNLTLAHIGARPSAKDEFNALTAMYLGRCAAFAHCQAEAFRSEETFLEWMGRQQGRTPLIAVLLDSRGKQMSSEVFAAWLGTRRDEGAQHIVFAIGPASGWSDAARGQAKLLLSLGPMILAHALARLVAAEQLYRAFTILTGHPYHGGH